MSVKIVINLGAEDMGVLMLDAAILLNTLGPERCAVTDLTPGPDAEVTIEATYDSVAQFVETIAEGVAE